VQGTLEKALPWRASASAEIKQSVNHQTSMDHAVWAPAFVGATACVASSGTPLHRHALFRIEINDRRSSIMGRYLLLWMLGIPLPILVLIYMFGGLH
jgi:hypothetical protein